MHRNDDERQTARASLLGGAATYTSLKAAGVGRGTLRGMLRNGEIERADHGIYRLVEGQVLQYPQWDAIALKYPGMIVCLLSAAVHHGLTTQVPGKTWVALPPGARPSDPSVRAVHWPNFNADGSPHRLRTVGVDTVRDGNRDYLVTSPARTVVDLFRWARAGEDLREAERTYVEALKGYCDSHDRKALREVADAFGVKDRIGDDIVVGQTFQQGW